MRNTASCERQEAVFFVDKMKEKMIAVGKNLQNERLF